MRKKREMEEITSEAQKKNKNMFADKKKGVHKPTFIVHLKENFEALCYYVKMQT